MLHGQIERDEIVERYVRHRLKPEEREAFEEHYFVCDECFEKVQAMEQFVAGINDMAGRGELSDAAEEPVQRAHFGWPLWAFAGASVAAVVLAAMTGWAYLHRIPALQQELNAAAGAHAQPITVAQLRPEGIPSPSPEANVPVVVLQSSRGTASNSAVLPPGAKQLILWAEIGPTRYTTYSMEIDSPSGYPLMTVGGLTRGPYGALAASLPAESLRPGTLRIKLIGQTPQPPSLVSEYRLQIRTP